MARRGEYGVQNMHFYPMEGEEYGDLIIVQEGMRSVSREITQEITTFYADNRAHLQITGAKTIAGEIVTYQLEDEVYTEMLGFERQPNGGFVDGATSRRFGMAYAKKVVESDGTELFKIVVIYDCIATEPNEQTTTSEDAVELTELTFAYESKVSNFVESANGTKVSYFFKTMPEGTTEADIEALFGAGIPLPSDEIGTVVLATGSFGTSDEPTVDTLSGVYTYQANDSNISEARIDIFTSADLTTVVDTLPVTEGVDQAWSFGALEANTAYTIKLMQGTTELDSVDLTTLMA